MLENVMKLTPDEIICLDGLVSVAKEAKAAYMLIQKAYSKAFGIGQDRIEVWSDGVNYEYLTHAGVWEAHYLYQNYAVECSLEEIFKYYRAAYLIDKGFAKEFEEGSITEEGELAQVCRYFKGFVNKTKNDLTAASKSSEIEDREFKELLDQLSGE